MNELPLTDAETRLVSINKFIEELQGSCSWKAYGRWNSLFIAACYGFIAYLQGPPVFIVYMGVLVVVFSLEASSDKRSRKQIDLIVALVREVEKKKAA